MPPFLITVFQFLLGYMELLAVWTGILVWEAFAKIPISAETKWSLYVGTLAGASFWNWRREVLRARAAEAALTLARKRPNTVRTFANDPEALLERYGDTGMTAEQLLIPHLDKWIIVVGRFEGIADSLVGGAIHLSLALESGRRVHLRFPVEAREQLQSVREGQWLTAVCQIQHGYGTGVFALEKSELIRVERLRPALALVS